MGGDFELKQVTVRMYRPGLGDCFLLTFASTMGECRYMLIDCGVLQNTTGQEDRLGMIIEDIKKQCGGSDTSPGTLHIVVATHEHDDHVSGFGFHREKFQNEFRIEDVWLPWTEDKQNPKVVETYSTVRGTPLDELKQAIQQYAGTHSNIPDSIKKVKDLFDFLSEGGMDSLKCLVNKPTYLSPESNAANGPTRVVTRADFGTVRFHVLAPPEDPKALGRADIPKNKNQIQRGEALSLSTTFTAAFLKHRANSQAGAAHGSELDIEELFSLCLPFDKTRLVRMEQARKDKFFIEHYGFAEHEGPQGPEWRRIDNDWMEVGTELALDLDNHTNNTSLVLAIELSPGGKVMLFPGDAQHGSWLSWATTPKGIDLLNRTVFYKVGHHGSNNATLVRGGLDQMKKEQLVAMLPVDPVRQPSFHLPDNERLLPRIRLQARGRVIQACEGKETDEPCGCVDFRPPFDTPADMPMTEWKKFTDAICWDKSPDRLWVEYTLPV